MYGFTTVMYLGTNLFRYVIQSKHQLDTCSNSLVNFLVEVVNYPIFGGNYH